MKDFAPNTTKVEICVHSLNVGMEKELNCLEADCSEAFGVRRRNQVTRAWLCRLSTLLLVLLYSLLPGMVVSQGILYPVVYYRPAKYTGANLAKIEVLSFSTTYHAPSNAFIYPGISYSSTNPAEIRAIRSDGTVAGIQPNQALYSTNGVMVGTSSDMFIAGLNNGIFVTRILNGGSQA